MTKMQKIDHFDIERKLVSSLKKMAYLFFFLSLVSLIFAFFVHKDTDQIMELHVHQDSILTDIETLSGATLFTDMQPLEPSAQDILNFYIVSLLFASIGTWLFYLSAKKRKIHEKSHNAISTLES